MRPVPLAGAKDVHVALLATAQAVVADQAPRPPERPPFVLGRSGVDAHPESLDRVNAERDALNAEISRLIAVVAELERVDHDLAQVKKAIESALGLNARRPQGSEAVGLVAIEAMAIGRSEGRDGALTVREIVAELERRGWAPDSKNPEAAVRAAIQRLRDRDPRWGLYKGRLYYHDREGVPESEEGDDS